MDSLCAGLDGGRKARRNFGKFFASTPITPLPQTLCTLRTTKKKSKQPRREKQFPKNRLRRTDTVAPATTVRCGTENPRPPINKGDSRTTRSTLVVQWTE